MVTTNCNQNNTSNEPENFNTSSHGPQSTQEFKKIKDRIFIGTQGA